MPNLNAVVSGAFIGTGTVGFHLEGRRELTERRLGGCGPWFKHWRALND